MIGMRILKGMPLNRLLKLYMKRRQSLRQRIGLILRMLKWKKMVDLRKMHRMELEQMVNRGRLHRMELRQKVTWKMLRRKNGGATRRQRELCWVELETMADVRKMQRMELEQMVKRGRLDRMEVGQKVTWKML